MLLNFPFELKKTAGNCIDSVHSISRNIAEGYCRKGIKEYLNFLNIALASSGEFHSSLISFVKANQISKEDFEKLDELHYKTENALIRLIKSLQIKLKDGSWETSFRE
jgi:four helix bundle protein